MRILVHRADGDVAQWARDIAAALPGVETVAWREGDTVAGCDYAIVWTPPPALLDRLARDTRTAVECDWFFIRDSFYLDQTAPLVAAFQAAYESNGGAPLEIGPKPFVDDGNSFWSLARVPAITHGPKAGGQHTVNEWVEIDDLERVARGGRTPP